MMMLNFIGILICLPFAFIHNVAPFVYFTAACLVIIFISVFTVGGYMVGIINHMGPRQSAVYQNWSNFPEFFGMACFSLEGIG